MPSSGSYQIDAIVIKKTKLGEADRILTFYTPDMGKVQAVAKGVRKPKAKLSGHLELLTYSRVLLTRGRNLDTIVGCQAVESFMPIKSDLDLCVYGLYATELILQFGVERQENSQLFNLLLRLLRELCSHDNRGMTEMLLRYFEVQLLRSVGYDPQLGECVACRDPLPEANVHFSLASGGVVCPRCRPSQSYAYVLSRDALRILQTLQKADWLTIPESGDSKVAREIELLLRNYLRYILERETRSAAWMDTLRHARLQATRPAEPSPE